MSTPKKYKARGAFGYAYGDTIEEALCNLKRTCPAEGAGNITVCARVDLPDRGTHAYPEELRIPLTIAQIREGWSKR